ncbi:hypothetical protein BKA64DRAFT_701545 [Cadophora sp. MPI-SDFR-AT-0126]|nr:hypothetical protein BKA64DRAFT_701545 [Leotiomycetes sp. MPI-SDFR-AT-0126]
MSSINKKPPQLGEDSDMPSSITTSHAQVDLNPAVIPSAKDSSLFTTTTKAVKSSELELSPTTQVIMMDQITDLAMTLENFTLFPKLPAEMRFKIWFHSLPGPRVVEVDYLCTSEWVCRRESQSKPSGMLRASKESRAEFLKYYSAFLEIVIPVPLDPEDLQDEHRLAPGSITYIDPLLDTLYISANHWDTVSVTEKSIGELVSMKCLEKLETVACEYSEVKDGFGDDWEVPAASFFPNIKNIIVSIGDITFRQLLYQDMERSAGEIIFKNVEQWGAYSLQQSASLVLRMDEAKKMFFDSSGGDLDTCSITRIFRGGVEMNFKIHDF